MIMIIFYLIKAKNSCLTHVLLTYLLITFIRICEKNFQRLGEVIKPNSRSNQMLWRGQVVVLTVYESLTTQ